MAKQIIMYLQSAAKGITLRLRQGLNFIHFVAKAFMNNGGTYRASALTFTTLLAIVPLMLVSFTTLSAFPMFKDVASDIQDFIFANFVPTAGREIQTYLQNFAEHAAHLSLFSILALLITAVLVLFTIERSLNVTWHATRRRKGVAAFLLYWAVLTLAPLLMGVGFVLSSYVFSLPFLKANAAGFGLAKVWLLSVAPFLLTVITITLVYVAVPNTKVRIKHAFVGALFVGVLFESAKLGFSFYLQQFNTYTLIYGAFAAVPLFFIWLYWIWVIVLLGGEITYALSTYYARRMGPKLDAFSQAFIWLYYFWQAQQTGQTIHLKQLIKRDLFAYQVEPAKLLHALSQARLIKRLNQEEYVLVQDLSNLSLAKLIQQLPYKFPLATDLKPFKTPVLRQLEDLAQTYEGNQPTIILAELFGKLAPRDGLEPPT